MQTSNNLSGITVVNKHHKVPYDVYIGRGSKWGNPFSHLPSSKALVIAHSREDALDMFRIWIRTQQHLLDSLHELDGKVLGCYCVPKDCHGYELIKIREEQIANATK